MGLENDPRYGSTMGWLRVDPRLRENFCPEVDRAVRVREIWVRGSREQMLSAGGQFPEKGGKAGLTGFSTHLSQRLLLLAVESS